MLCSAWSVAHRVLRAGRDSTLPWHHAHALLPACQHAHRMHAASLHPCLPGTPLLSGVLAACPRSAAARRSSCKRQAPHSRAPITCKPPGASSAQPKLPAACPRPAAARDRLCRAVRRQPARPVEPAEHKPRQLVTTRAAQAKEVGTAPAQAAGRAGAARSLDQQHIYEAQWQARASGGCSYQHARCSHRSVQTPSRC